MRRCRIAPAEGEFALRRCRMNKARSANCIKPKAYWTKAQPNCPMGDWLLFYNKNFRDNYVLMVGSKALAGGEYEVNAGVTESRCSRFRPRWLWPPRALLWWTRRPLILAILTSASRARPLMAMGPHSSLTGLGKANELLLKRDLRWRWFWGVWCRRVAMYMDDAVLLPNSRSLPGCGEGVSFLRCSGIVGSLHQVIAIKMPIACTKPFAVGTIGFNTEYFFGE